MYCSRSCHNKVSQSYPAQKRRGIARKLDLIKKLGGKCNICGYDRNISALTFHHISGVKEFQLDVRSLSNRTLALAYSEIKKCQLLCANCHAEKHYPDMNLAGLSIEPTALTTELRAHTSTIKELP